MSRIERDYIDYAPLRSYRDCGRDEDYCGRRDCYTCAEPTVLELDAEEEAALAEVPQPVLDLLAEGNESSFIGAIARARRGGVQS